MDLDSASIGMLAALIILVVFSAYFSATETAFTSLNRIRLKARADDGNLRAARTLKLAEDYDKLTSNCSSVFEKRDIKDSDDAAIYFSSGTTGFPKAILHNHESLMHAAKVENVHHGQTKDDVFLCIPPLYHTGAKMHWFGSLIVGGKAVLLKGVSAKTILQTVSDEKLSLIHI